MGKSITPKYRARYRDQKGWHDIMWKGRPSDARAEQTRKDYNKSFQPGGANWRVSELSGYVPHISKFEVIRNVYGGEVVASATAPMFEIV